MRRPSTCLSPKPKGEESSQTPKHISKCTIGVQLINLLGLKTSPTWLLSVFAVQSSPKIKVIRWTLVAAESMYIRKGFQFLYGASYLYLSLQHRSKALVTALNRSQRSNLLGSTVALSPSGFCYGVLMDGY